MKNFFTFSFLLLGLLCTPRANATHIIAYDGYATCIGETQDSISLEVTIVLYRDSIASSIDFDQQIEMGIYVNKTNGSLMQVKTMSVTKKYALFPASNGLAGIYQGLHTTTVSLPKIASGYSFLFRRCCFSVVNNLMDDQGFDLRIEIPPGMGNGDKTPSITAFPAFVLKTGKRYAIPHAFQHALYDSVKIEYTYLLTGAANSDPAPTPPQLLPAKVPSQFNAGFSEQNPLGVNNTCDYTSEPDSLILQVNQDADFLLPLNATCYKNGVEYLYNRVFRIRASGFPPNYLSLALAGSNWTTVDLKANTLINGQDELVLERSDNPGFSSAVEVETGVSYGMGIDLSDDSLVLGSPLYYRLKLKSNPEEYSNTVEVLPSGVKSVSGPLSFPIYPNPASSTVHIDLAEAGAFALYSSKGEVIYQGLLEAGNPVLSVENIPNGIYFIRIGHRTQKLVVSH